MSDQLMRLKDGRVVQVEQMGPHTEGWVIVREWLELPTMYKPTMRRYSMSIEFMVGACEVTD